MPFIHTLYAQVSHAQKNCASNMDQIAVKGVPASCHIPGRKELGQRQPQNKESSSVVGFLRARGQGSSEGFFLPPQCKVGWKRDKKEGVFLLFCFLFFLDHHAGNWFLFTNPCSPNVYSWPQLILWNVCFYPIQKKKGGGRKIYCSTNWTLNTCLGLVGYLHSSLCSDSGYHLFDTEWLKSLPFKYAFDGKGLF